jgi:hypothetical protein
MQGIMYSQAMTLANLEGRKSRTSRCRGLDKINQNPDEWECTAINQYPKNLPGAYFHNKNTDEVMFVKCPYGGIGSELYGKETFFAWSGGAGGMSNILFCGDPEIPALLKDNELLKEFRKKENKEEVIFGKWGWHSSMLMPEWASRYHIILTGIGCQRIQSITEEDCIKEGLIPHRRHVVVGLMVDPRIGRFENISAYSQFRTLWDSINLKTHPWKLNPWCWVLYYTVKKKEASHDPD